MREVCRNGGLWVVIALGATALLGAAGRQVAERHASCSSNLKQLHMALQMYSLDYDGKLPTMPNEKRFHDELWDYTKNEAIFICPDSHVPYLPASALGGKKLEQVKSQVSTLIVRDSKPHSDGLYNLLFVDGHQARVRNLPKPTPAKPRHKGKKH